MPTKEMRSSPMLRNQFFLARELKMTHKAFQREVTGVEFIRWVAFYQLEQREQDKAQQAAEDKAQARQLARTLR